MSGRPWAACRRTSGRPARWASTPPFSSAVIAMSCMMVALVPVAGGERRIEELPLERLHHPMDDAIAKLAAA